MEGNKIFAYMRKSTNKKSQKLDRQEYELLKYASKNNFVIDEFFFDIITGETKADDRENYHYMKQCLRSGDTVIVTDIDRIGRNTDDVILEIKDLQMKKVRVVILDIPYMNDWKTIYDESIYKMAIDMFIVIKAHIAQQEKEKIHDRIMQGLDVARKNGKKLGRPATGVPKEFIKEYNKLQSGEYGNISVVQFAKLQGIAVSTFYKYVGILTQKKGDEE